MLHATKAGKTDEPIKKENRGGYRISWKLRQELMYIRQTLTYAEDEVTTRGVKQRISTAKGMIDQYLDNIK